MPLLPILNVCQSLSIVKFPQLNVRQMFHVLQYSHCSADMIKSMVKSVEEQSRSVQDSDRPTAVTSHGSDKGDGSSSGVSPLMSFVMANDTNYKQKVYKPLLKRPTAGIAPAVYICMCVYVCVCT